MQEFSKHSNLHESTKKKKKKEANVRCKESIYVLTTYIGIKKMTAIKSLAWL